MDVDIAKALWNRYFANPLADAQDTRLAVVDVFYMFFQTHGAHLFPLHHTRPRETESSVYLKVAEMAHLISASGIKDFEAFLRSRPMETIGCVGVAMSLLHERKYGHARLGKQLATLRPRFLNLGDPIPYENLKVCSVGQLVTVVGHVVRVSPTRPFIEGAYFACGGCGEDTWANFENGLYQPPARCSSDKCYKKTFELRREKSAIICDYQRVKIQEPDQAVEDTARIPRTFEVEVRGVDQVNGCLSGDVVKVVGTICTAQVNQGGGKGGYRGGKKGGESALHTMYILANSMTTVRRNGQSDRQQQHHQQQQSTVHKRARREGPEKENDGRANQEQAEEQEEEDALAQVRAGEAEGGAFSEEERASFENIRATGDSMGLLVASFCPGIFGHESVKLGLLLGLLGGTHSAERQIRSDVHVLIVGDPGLGKSQLLRAASNCSPRSVVICGNTATTAGLTVAVSREDNGEMSLEAGALVLANQGVCCIDELDKMQCDPHALLEAMEQQSISVAKSGVVTSIRCRTSVLAAANPVGGHYNRRKSVSENLKMNAALLSRFDLVFILMDKPDLEKDNMISEHILRTHNLAYGGTQDHKASNTASSAAAWGDNGGLSTETAEGVFSLTQRLRRTVARLSTTPTLPEALVRRYIEYSRKNVHPRMTVSAAKKLQKLYLTMRSQAKLGNSIPVTTRHLESLIRLSQARARLDLRDSVTDADAQDVIDLLHESLLDAFTNEAGEVEVGRKGGVAKQIKALVKALTQQAQMRNNNVFHQEQIVETCAALRLEKSPTDLIETMHTECYLLKKGGRLWQLNTSD
jgi:DNA helicase MCM8